MRARTLTLLLALVAVLLTLVAPASAQEDEHEGEEELPEHVTPEGAVPIGDGLSVFGAVITPLDGGAPRELDATQAAAFTQSMLAAAYWGSSDIAKDPPADAPVSRVEITGQWGLADGVLTVHYAEDGSTGYAAFPGLDITETTVVPPPEPATWFQGPEAMYLAFNGRGEVAETFGIQQDTELADPDQAASEDAPSGEGSGSSASDSDDPPWWILAGVGAAVLVGGAWLWRRRRGSGGTDGTGGADGTEGFDGPGGPDGTDGRDRPVDARVAPGA